MTSALLVEELLPGTDVLLSATLAFFAQEAGWLTENGLRVDEKVHKAAGEVVEKGLECFKEGMRVSGLSVAARTGEKDGAAKGGTAKTGFWS